MPVEVGLALVALVIVQAGASACALCGAIDGQSLSALDLFFGTGASGLSLAGGVSLEWLNAAAERDRIIEDFRRDFYHPPPPEGTSEHTLWENRRAWAEYFRNTETIVWIDYGPGQATMHTEGVAIIDLTGIDKYSPAPPPL